MSIFKHFDVRHVTLYKDVLKTKGFVINQLINGLLESKVSLYHGSRKTFVPNSIDHIEKSISCEMNFIEVSKVYSGTATKKHRKDQNPHPAKDTKRVRNTNTQDGIKKNSTLSGNEPRHEKTCLRGWDSSRPTQLQKPARLLNLEMLDLASIELCDILCCNHYSTLTVQMLGYVGCLNFVGSLR